MPTNLWILPESMLVRITKIMLNPIVKSLYINILNIEQAPFFLKPHCGNFKNNVRS